MTDSYYSKTPREAQLEREVEMLKSKVAYLERGQDTSRSFSRLYEPQEIEVPKLPPTHTLRLSADFGWKPSTVQNGFHVFARERFADGMLAGYYVDNSMLMYPRFERTRILADCLERATRDLQESV